MDAEGDIISAHNGERSVEGFAKTASAAVDYADTKKRYESGDKQAAGKYLKAGLDLGLLPAETAREILAGLKDLSAEEIKEINNKIASAEFAEVLNGVRSQEAAAAAGEKFLAMLDRGFVPEGMQKPNLWVMIGYHAEDKKDVALLKRAIEEFGKVASEGRRRDAMIERMESVLEEIKN